MQRGQLSKERTGHDGQIRTFTMTFCALRRGSKYGICTEAVDLRVSSLIHQREDQSILYLASDIAVTVNPRCLAVQFDPTIIVQNVSSYLVLKFPTPAFEDVCPANILHADRFSAEEKDRQI